MAWYRKYRPQQVSQLQLPPVREQLQQILKTGQYAHAYLFTGPKGTGKTSSARILARLLNEPKNRENVLSQRGPLVEPTLDDPLLQKIAQGQSQVVIEQDAASHRGIDDIRQLQEEVSIVPTEGVVRVVILDEVHMLTNEAFNALLKLLEEPPQQVVFILATTELHKVPATVQSRCQIIRFRQATPEEITEVLQVIAKGEKVDLSTEAALALAQAAQGSFRDAVKYFEQSASAGQLTAESLIAVIGNSQMTQDLLRGLAQQDAKQVAELFQQWRSQGTNFGAIEQAILLALQERLHRAIARGEKGQTINRIIELLAHLAQRLGGSEPIEGIKLEVACLQWCLRSDSGEVSIETEPPKAKPKTPPTKSIAAEREEEVVTVSATVQEVKASVSESSVGRLEVAHLKKAWPKLLIAVRSKSAAIEAILRNAEFGEITDQSLELRLALPFHKERLETPKYLSVLVDVLRQQLGIPHLEVVLSVQAQVASDGRVDSITEKDDLLSVVENLVVGMS